MGYPKDVKKHDADKYHAIWSALDNVVNAWEAEMRKHSTERWLVEKLLPAINEARHVLGRKAPNE